jgi:serine/threonine-protein kinase TTK/MPS1
MLQAVHSIHEVNIIHSDLKPANFLLVSGSLKLIDFGIAKRIANDTTNIYRDHQTGTVNYMSPEALVSAGGPDFKLGRASDVWSLGCILYQLVYGAPPFASLGVMQKIKAIADPNHVISYPSGKSEELVGIIKSCLEFSAKRRATIPGLLAHEYLTGVKGGGKSGGIKAAVGNPCDPGISRDVYG